MPIAIIFVNSRLEELCNNYKQAVKKWGERRATLVFRRLDDMRAARTLVDMKTLPGDCHIYKHGKGRHLLSLDLDGGNRLLFEPAHDPAPLLKDGTSLDWSQVTAVIVVAVGDPHEHD